MVWLRLHGSTQVLLACQENGPLLEKSKKMGIDIGVLPFFPWSAKSFFRTWLGLSRILRDARERQERLECVWTFEGREHTLAVLHRVFQKKLWSGVRLVRVRGQAAPTRNSFVNRWLYSKGCDGVVFVADVVRNRTAFSIPAQQNLVFPYCADFSHGVRPWEMAHGRTPSENSSSSYEWMPEAPAVRFEDTLFVVVGRYDPVKGHKELLDAFAQMDTHNRPVQLVFIGCSENVKAKDLYVYAKNKLRGSSSFQNARGCVQSHCGWKSFYICDERFSDVPLFVKRAHWGVIPSLGSEVICRVAVEFLQNGTPCLASDVGALREVLEGSPSRIVPLGHSEEWKRALESANSIASDAAFFYHVRNQCRRFGTEKYHWSRYAELVKWVKSLSLQGE
jgi:glycosyltransferase involved in cell wall biosynthesis